METSSILLITYVTISIIAVMTIFALLSRRASVCFSAPSILTSLGIFGTFLGITVGLSSFDPQNISGTVPLLFSGIKLAFWTSVAGILGGILVRFRLLLFPLEDQVATEQRVGLHDLVNAMRGVEASLKDKDDDRPWLEKLRDLLQTGNTQGDKLATQMEKVGHHLDQAADRGDALVANVQDIRDGTRALQGSIDAGNAATLSGLSEAIAAQGAGLADSLRTELGSLGSQLGEGQQASSEVIGAALAAQTARLADSIRADLGALGSQLGEGQSETGKAISEAVAEQAGTLADSQRAASDAINAALATQTAKLAESIRGDLGTLGSQLSEGQSETGKAIGDAVAKQAGTLADSQRAASDAINAALGAQTAKLAESIRGDLGQLGGLLDKRQQASSEQIAAALVAQAGRLADNLEQNLQALGSLLSEDNASAAERIGQALADTRQALGGTLESGQLALNEQLTGLTKELRDAIIGPDGATQTLASQMQKDQAEMAGALVRVADGIRAALSENAETVAARLADSSASSSEQMQKLGETIKALHEAMGEDAAATLQRLDAVREGSAALGERLASVLGGNNEALAQAIETLQTTMGKDTDALIGRLENLRQGSTALGDRLAEVLGASNEALTEALAGNRDALAAQVATAVTDLRDAIVGTDGATHILTSQMQKDQAEMASALVRVADSIRAALGENADVVASRLADTSATSAEGMQKLGEAIHALHEAMGEDAAATLQRLDAVREGSAALGERLASVLGGNNEALAQAIETLQTTMGKDTDALIGRLENLRQGSTALGDRLAEVLGASNEALTEALASNRDALAAQVATAVTDLRDALVGPEGAARVISKDVQESQMQLAQALGRTAENLRGAVLDKLAAGEDLTAEGLRSMAQAVESLQGTMRGDTASVLESLGEVREGTQGLGDRLAHALSENAASLNEGLKHLREALGSDAARLLTGLAEIRKGTEGLGERLGTALSENQAAVTQALDGLLSTLGDDAGQILKALGQLGEGTEALGDRLSGALSGNSEAVGKALTELQSAMGEDAASVLQALGENSAAMSGAVQGLQGALGKDAAKVLAGLGQLFQGTEQLGERLSEALGENREAMTEALRNLHDTLGEDASTMEKRIAALGEGTQAMGERLSQAVLASNEAIAEALQAARDVMAARVTEGVTQLRDALVGPDGAANELGRQLQQGQVELADALLRTSEALRGGMAEDVAATLERIDSLNSGLHDLAESVASSFGESAGGLAGDVNNMAATVADAIDDLRMAIVGPEGAREGILEEMRTSRADTGAALEAIHKAVAENTQRQVDYSPRGLMDVLEELIRQFNTQFSGQFWEKLGGFNTSVAELTEWMETYRKQLTDMVEQQSKSAKNMDTATRRFDEVASKSEIFIDVSRNMSSLLGGLDAQRVQMESHLKSFAHIVDETRANLENIEEQIVGGNENMNKHLKEISERIEEQVIRVDHAMDEELRKALTTFGQQLSALSEKFVEDYTPLTERLREVVNISRSV